MCTHGMFNYSPWGPNCQRWLGSLSFRRLAGVLTSRCIRWPGNPVQRAFAPRVPAEANSVAMTSRGPEAQFVRTRNLAAYPVLTLEDRRRFGFGAGNTKHRTRNDTPLEPLAAARLRTGATRQRRAGAAQRQVHPAAHCGGCRTTRTQGRNVVRRIKRGAAHHDPPSFPCGLKWRRPYRDQRTRHERSDW